MTSLEPPNHQQIHDAIQWLVQFEAGGMDISSQKAFVLWLEESPQHQLAWHRLGKANQYFSYDDVGAATPLSANMTLQALQKSDAHLAQKRRTLKMIAATMGVGIGSWLTRDFNGLGYAYDYATADLRTDVGKQHQQTLADGSELLLNTQTAVDIDFAAQPQINLLYGELSLQLANHKANIGLPLQIRAGRHLFILGPDSDITLYQHDQACVLQVITGSVQCVFSAGREINVTANQNVTLYSDQREPHITALDLHALSWRQGLLTAERHRLGDFVQQLARYRPGYLGYAGEIAGLTLSGSFPLDNTDVIIDNLCQILPIRQQRFSRYWVRLLPA